MDFSNRERKLVNSSDSWQWRLSFIGRHMQHSYYLYHIIDKIMLENPGLMGIVELGTGNGALTTVLGLWGISKGIPVVSVDTVHSHSNEIFKILQITYLQLDENSGPLINKIGRFIEGISGPILFICDGGNKIREFNFWAPLLKPDSIIAAHDWTIEIDMEGIMEVANGLCSKYHEERWNEMNVQLGTFKINKTNPFLSIVTRNHPKRANLLLRCINSVKKLKDRDYKHVILYDNGGYGIPHANRMFFENRHKVTGKYVFILDDDDILITDDLVDDLKILDERENHPDIIFILSSIHNQIYPLPSVWEGSEMIPGAIGSSCVVIKNELWQSSIDSFRTTETPGDFNFINQTFTSAKSVYWQGKHYSKSTQLNRGASEESAK